MSNFFNRPPRRTKGPSETQEAITLASYMRMHLPEILFAHLANENQQSKMSEGLLPGLPDYLIAEARGVYFGLFLELKRRDKTNKPTKKQIECMEKLESRGYKCVVGYGWKESVELIKEYLSLTS
jgi:hypothetical protein